MKLFRLNSAYLPDKTVPKFSSLAWTERYREAGDFQVIVENDIEILDILPVGALISHTDTHEVMIVENHEIDRDSNRLLTVTVSGRSFETFAENRPTFGSYAALTNSTTGDANVEILATQPANQAGTLLFQQAFQDGYAGVGYSIPNVQVSMNVRVLDPAMAHPVQRGDIYTRALEFLAVGDSGVMTYRPDYSTGPTYLQVIVHDGVDRRNAVIFYAQYEDLEDAKYFWSIKDYKNCAIVAAKYYVRFYQHRDLPFLPSGLDRRVLYVEASDLEGNYSPPSASDVISSRGQNALDEHRKIALLQATISPSAKPKFKIDYDVGDLVTVFGEFSTAQTMRVTEHILTVDSSGAKGFPSLSVV